MQVSHIMQSGRLTRDPEVRYSAKGKAVCNFQIAFNKRWKDTSGEEKEKVNFFSCSAFGITAEVIGKHLAKGDMALFEGELEHQTWMKDDEKRETVKISVQRVHFVGNKKKPEDGAEKAPKNVASNDAGVDLESDDIPF